MFKSFTVGLTGHYGAKNDLLETDKKNGKEEDDVSAEEKERILRMIEQEDSSDEEEDSSAELEGHGENVRDGASGGDLKGEADRKGSESGSWCSDTDILNRSL